MLHEYYDENIVPNIQYSKLAKLFGKEEKIFADKHRLITENSTLWPVSSRINVIKVHEKDMIEEMAEFFERIFSFEKIEGMPIKIKFSVDFCGTWECDIESRDEDPVVRFPSPPTSFLKDELIINKKDATKFIEKWKSFSYEDFVYFWLEEHRNVLPTYNNPGSHFSPFRIISTHVYLHVLNMLD